MRIEELYSKYDEILKGLNVSSIQHCLFDLEDENSQNSLKHAFPGIETILMPESGKYLIITTIVEDKDCLLMLFPEQKDGNLSMKVFNVATRKSKDLLPSSSQDGGEKITIDNFKDFADMEEITNRFNEFVFNGSDGENSADEVIKNIGSFDVSTDEPVEIKNDTNTDNEETKMKFKPIEDESVDNEKWIEIPNINAKGVTVTEDGEEEDPFAGEMPAGDATQDAAPADNGDAQATDAPAQDAPAQDVTIDDPKAKMRELLAYYTNYMTELVKDPNTSTELISATQEMIDSLIKNMENADGIEEVKAEGEEEAKATEEAPAEEAPANDNGDEEQAIQEAIDDKIDKEVDDLHSDDIDMDIEPIQGDNILTPGDIGNSMVNDVDISGMMPTPDEELAATSPDMDAPSPTSDVLDDTAPMTPDEEVELLGSDDTEMFGPDGLPIEKFDGDVDSLTCAPCAKKVLWSTDYATNGVATSDDNCNVVPSVLNELVDYYKNVANEVSKVPGKEDVAMKLQKIQILSQTIANEWNGIVNDLGCCANSYDRSNMGDLEKDEVDSMDAMNQVGQDIMADQEQDEEDDLAIDAEIDKFVESFKHLI